MVLHQNSSLAALHHFVEQKEHHYIEYDTKCSSQRQMLIKEAEKHDDKLHNYNYLMYKQKIYLHEEKTSPKLMSHSLLSRPSGVLGA